jgi:hypothetical protein
LERSRGPPPENVREASDWADWFGPESAGNYLFGKGRLTRPPNAVVTAEGSCVVSEPAVNAGLKPKQITLVRARAPHSPTGFQGFNDHDQRHRDLDEPGDQTSREPGV